MSPSHQQAEKLKPDEVTGEAGDGLVSTPNLLHFVSLINGHQQLRLQAGHHTLGPTACRAFVRNGMRTILAAEHRALTRNGGGRTIVTTEGGNAIKGLSPSDIAATGHNEWEARYP